MFDIGIKGEAGEYKRRIEEDVSLSVKQIIYAYTEKLSGFRNAHISNLVMELVFLTCMGRYGEEFFFCFPVKGLVKSPFHTV